MLAMSAAHAELIKAVELLQEHMPEEAARIAESCAANMSTAAMFLNLAAEKGKATLPAPVPAVIGSVSLAM